MDITGPILLLDKDICLRNISRMANKAKLGGVRFRPHFKTHQSAVVGNWFRDFGVTAITVSSAGMAEYFAAAGWNDITIAFPVNLLEEHRLRHLSESVHLNLLVESVPAVSSLGSMLRQETGIYIEIDAGYHRSGFSPEDLPGIREILEEIRKYPQLRAQGFLAHFGNTYQEKTPNGVIRVYHESLSRMKIMAGELARDYPGLSLSVGDTPSCSIVEDLSGADEIRPGNFVFYDMMQCAIGSCTPGDVAVCLAAPVVAKYRDRLELVVHAGAIHLSKERLASGDPEHFGLVAALDAGGWGPPMEDCFVKSLSQEHGVIRVTEEVFDTIRTGDLIGILPVHSCLTVAAMRSYTTMQGESIRTC